MNFGGGLPGLGGGAIGAEDPEFLSGLRKFACFLAIPLGEGEGEGVGEGVECGR